MPVGETEEQAKLRFQVNCYIFTFFHPLLLGGDGVCSEPCQPQLSAFPCSKRLHEGSLLCQLPKLPDVLEGWKHNWSFMQVLTPFSLGAGLCVLFKVSGLPSLPRAVTTRNLQEGNCVGTMCKIPRWSGLFCIFMLVKYFPLIIFQHRWSCIGNTILDGEQNCLKQRLTR